MIDQIIDEHDAPSGYRAVKFTECSKCDLYKKHLIPGVRSVQGTIVVSTHVHSGFEMITNLLCSRN